MGHPRTEPLLDEALAGGGLVAFSCGDDTVTITVTSTKTISRDTTIDGGGLITISGGGSVGVFYVNGAQFTVQNLTITAGKNSTARGGGVANWNGTLTVTNSVFTDNTSGVDGGGGIANTNGVLTITGSVFSGNTGPYGGGGIGNFGRTTVTVSNSLFVGNRANGAGGGIWMDRGAITVVNSTFSGNDAGSNGAGGGIRCELADLYLANSVFSANAAAYGGGIMGCGLRIVVNSTFFGNHAAGYGGGIFGGGGSVINSTFANNSAGGGGAIAGGAVEFTNSILVDNISDPTQGPNCYPQFRDGGHNIDDGSTCGFTGTGCSSTAGTSFCNTSAALDPAGLQDNGGLTQTVALCTGAGVPSAGCAGTSIAINHGDESKCSSGSVRNLDQRGFVRPGTGAANCAIGAFEANSPGPGACGDGAVAGDEECDDGNNAAGDGCSANCTLETGWACAGHQSSCTPICGDGMIVGAEQCDDGNLTAGDCCSAECDFESVTTVCRPSVGICDVPENCTGSSGSCPANSIVAPGTACGDPGVGQCTAADTCNEIGICSPNTLPAGTACDDGDGCTSNDACDARGVCAGEPICNDGNPCTQDTCVPSTGLCTFVAAPAVACLDAGNSALYVSLRADGKMKWKWQRGAAMTCDAIGAPDFDTDFDVCVYDGIGENEYNLATQLHLPASTLWSPLSSCRWTYVDSSSGADGVSRMNLSPGTAGRSRFRLVAGGAQLALPTPSAPEKLFAMNPSVTVQLFSGSSICWQAQYTDAYANTGEKFKTRKRY